MFHQHLTEVWAFYFALSIIRNWKSNFLREQYARKGGQNYSKYITALFKFRPKNAFTNVEAFNSIQK